jgi:hypothetical protein
MRRKEKLGKSMKIVNSIDFVGDVLQSFMTYVYIGSKTQLFELDTSKSFLTKRNFKPYSEFILSVKTGLSDFCEFGFLLDFILSWSLDAF